MKHLPALTALGLATCAAVLAPAAAMAQIQTYYHAGVWDAFSGRNEKGSAMCGIGTTNPANNRRVSLIFDIGGTNTVATATKPEWAIPDGTRVSVVMQLGLNTPWIEAGNGHGHSVSWVLDRSAAPVFDRQFAGALSMTLTFPDGNEPPWSVPLSGSTAINATFARCIRDLTRQVQAAQTGAPAQPAAVQGATQPYTPSAAGSQPPEPAKPAAPSGSGPDAAPTQPNAVR